MNKLVIASSNPGKIEEIKDILKDSQIDIYSLKDLGLDKVEIVEDGDTLKENAYIKGSRILDVLDGDYMVLSDDTGLFVNHLNGLPGVHSARYAGDHNDEKNRQKLLKDMEGAHDRGAYFQTVMALIRPGDHKDTYVYGRLDGKISHEEAGEGGFGYDSIFIADGYDKTLSQISLEEKNKISHRSKALDEISKVLL